MAACDIQALLDDGKCFYQLNTLTAQTVLLQLLCNAASTLEAGLVTESAPLLASSPAAETSRVVKASAGRLLSVTMFNGNGATRYLQGFNSATLPANGTVPLFSIAVAAGASATQLFGDAGLTLGTGIVVANSTTAATLTIGSADAIFVASYR